MTTINFEDLEPFIISYSPWLTGVFSIYSNHAPRKGDVLVIDDIRYLVNEVADDTCDKERDEGISISIIYSEEL